MKIRAEILLIKKQIIFNKKILITGSDEGFINFITGFVVKNYKEKNFYVDTSGTINENKSGDLFSNDKIVFLIKEVSSKKDLLNLYKNTDKHLIISAPNNKNSNSLKTGFSKLKDCLIIDCYPLNRGSKEIVVKNFLEANSLVLSNNVFWFVVDRFENDYVLLINQLNTLCLISNRLDSIREVEGVVFGENKTEANKIFFYVFKNKKFLIDAFSKNIFSKSDFYVFLNSLKLYLGIIALSSKQEDALSRFPKYLFNERDVFIKIYRSLNQKKIEHIYNNVFKVEKIIRKNSQMHSEIGLRFLLNVKKIITS